VKKRIEELVGVSLKRLDLNKDKVWKSKKDWRSKYPFLTKAMDELQYE
jgi:hypothetical protein